MSASTGFVVGTVAVVGIGKVVKGEGFSVQTFFAGGVLALSLSAMANVDEKLANLFAGAIFLTALYLYLIPIAEKTGLLDGKATKTTSIKVGTRGK